MSLTLIDTVKQHRMAAFIDMAAQQFELRMACHRFSNFWSERFFEAFASKQFQQAFLVIDATDLSAAQRLQQLEQGGRQRTPPTIRLGTDYRLHAFPPILRAHPGQISLSAATHSMPGWLRVQPKICSLTAQA